VARLRLVLLASTAALALLVGACSGAGAGPANAVDRYFALQGSGSHLLFATKRTAKPLTEDEAWRRSRKYVLDAKGGRTAVPAGYDASLVGDEPLFRKETKAVDGLTAVHWIRPERGTSGVQTVPRTSTIAGAAPNGWVIETPVDTGTAGQAYRLRRVTTDGSTTDLGIPIPDGRPFSVAGTPRGLLVVSAGSDGDPASDGTIQFMRWSAPGSYRRIYPGAGVAPQVGQVFGCGNSSSTLVRCTIGMDEDTRIRLIPLDGTRSLRSEEACAYLYPAVRTFAIAWTDRTSAHGCVPGRVEQRTTEGRLSVSTRRYSTLQEPVSAFGRLVVATSTQRHLVTISDPESAPNRIVGN